MTFNLGINHGGTEERRRVSMRTFTYSPFLLRALRASVVNYVFAMNHGIKRQPSLNASLERAAFVSP
jgi:hypothetical protein